MDGPLGILTLDCFHNLSKVIQMHQSLFLVKFYEVIDITKSYISVSETLKSPTEKKKHVYLSKSVSGIGEIFIPI